MKLFIIFAMLAGLALPALGSVVVHCQGVSSSHHLSDLQIVQVDGLFQYQASSCIMNKGQCQPYKQNGELGTSHTGDHAFTSYYDYSNSVSIVHYTQRDNWEYIDHRTGLELDFPSSTCSVPESN